MSEVGSMETGGVEGKMTYEEIKTAVEKHGTIWQDEDGHWYVDQPKLGDGETEEVAVGMAALALWPETGAPSPDKWDALRRAGPIRALVDEQAEDGGLWFVAETITEDYLQRALRKLHAVIESNPLSELRGMERGGEGPTHEEVLSALATFENSSERNGQEDGMRQALEWFVAFRKRNVAPVATLSVTEGAQPRQDEAQNLRYAKQIAEYIREKYFPDVPQWKPLTGDLFGLLMQIDNMLTGLVLARSVTEGVDGK